MERGKQGEREGELAYEPLFSEFVGEMTLVYL